MIYGKSELLRKLSDMAAKGWSNTQVRDLIDSLWRDPYSLRTSGFVLAGGTDAVIDLQQGGDWVTPEQDHWLTFSIEPVDKKFAFYQYRYKLTYHKRVSSEAITIPLTEGLHIVYYDFDTDSKQEILHVSSPPYSVTPALDWLIVHRCIVASVYFDAENEQIIAWNDQRYGSEWNPQMHKTLRNTLGSLRDTGLVLAGMTADAAGDDNTHAQFSITAGSVWHGDIYSASAGLSLGAQITLMIFNASHQPRLVVKTGWAVSFGTLLQYQDDGVLTDATDGYFVIYYIFQTNCRINEFISVPGLSEYEKLIDASLAKQDELETIKAWLPYTDFLHVGTAIFQTSAAYSNTPHSRIVSDGFTVWTEKSVVGDGTAGNKIRLKNDQETPEPGKFYGAHYLTGEKGFHGIDPRLLASGQAIYLHLNDSDVTGYKKALTTQPEDAMATYTAAANFVTGDVLIEEFCTESDYPGVTVIPAGPWIFNHWVAVGSGTQSLLVVKVYKRIASGTETELLNFTQAVTATVGAEQYYAVPMAQVELLATDRLVVKYYHRNAGAASATMYLFAEGNTVAEWKWSGYRIPLAAVSGENDFVEDVFVEQDPQFPIEYLKYTKDGVDYDITEIAKPNGIVWGGRVSWVELLTFSVQSVIYYIYATLCKILSTSFVTLDPADPDNPRIDVIAVDITSTVVVVKGTPAANPQRPTIDPETQIYLTHILIPAGATEPEDITNNIIYDENTEWAGVGTGVAVDFDDVSVPFHGSKCASAGSIDNNDTIVFTTGTPVDITNFPDVIMYILLKASMTPQHNLYLSWMRSGVIVSTEVVLPVSKSNVITWQNITIQMSAFTWSQSTVDALRLRWSKSGSNVAHNGFYLDLIKLESGIIQQVVSNSIVLTGDVTGSGVTGTPIPTVLATVNSNVGTFGSASKTVTVTVDAKGRIKAISENTILGGTDEKVAVESGGEADYLRPALQGVDADTVADADTFNFVKTASNLLKKITWANIKSTLKSYFDSLYQVILVSGTNIKTINNTTILGSGNISVTPSALALEIHNYTDGDFTLVLGDAENYLCVDYETPVEVTIPAHSDVAFPVPTVITIEQTGAGTVTIVADDGVTLNAYEGGVSTYGQYYGLQIIQVAEDVWTLIAGT